MTMSSDRVKRYSIMRGGHFSLPKKTKTRRRFVLDMIRRRVFQKGLILSADEVIL